MSKRNFEQISSNVKDTRDADTRAHGYFNKLFTFKESDLWLLPNSAQLFSEDVWTKPDLQELKESLNNVKSQLNQYRIEEWSQHTNKTDPAGKLRLDLKEHIKPEFLTGAWTKFYECLHSADQTIPCEAVQRGSVNSVHICEAPGAFVASLNHFLALQFPQLQWNWMASSLNPYYEGNDYSSMISDDRFMIHTIDNWNFGDDYTGNLLNWNNMDAIVLKASKMGKIDLVSADGSIDCSLQPGNQEAIVAQLIFCEILSALRLLSRGGNLVIKMFTLFEEKTVCMVYLLWCCFDTVQVFKPSTSKEGNSEVYFVCLKYRSNIPEEHINKFRMHHENGEFSKKSLFPLDCIPRCFMEQHKRCVLYFHNLQCKAINDNIDSYSRQNRKSNKRLHKKKEDFARAFIKRYELQPIQRHICKIDYNKTEQTNIRYHYGTYDHRKQLQFDNNKQLLELSHEFEMLASKLPDADCDELNCEQFEKQSACPVYGKIIEVLTSSKFVLGNYLVIYNKLCRLKSINPFQNWGSSTITESKKSDESFDSWEKRISVLLIEKLEKLEPGNDLSIGDPVLLTQFSIGLLYLIFTHSFKSVVFKSNVVELRCLISKDCLKELKEIILDSNKSNKALLGLISLRHIRLGSFYSAIFKYNCNYFYNLLNNQL